MIGNTFIGNSAGDEGQAVFNKGSYKSIRNNNWGGKNPSTSNDILIEWVFFGSNKHHVDSSPLRQELKLDYNVVGANETVRATQYFVKPDGSMFTGSIYNAPVDFILPENIKVINQGRTSNAVFIDFVAVKEGKYDIAANLYGQHATKTLTVHEWGP